MLRSYLSRLRSNIVWHWETKRTRLLYGWRLAHLGRGCIIAKNACVSGKGVEAGDHVRVDGFCSVVGSSDAGGAVLVQCATHLWPYAFLDSAGGSIRIGTNVSIGSYTEIYGHGGCVIGNDCQIAGHCYIIPANHRFVDPELPIRLQGLECKGIVIEEDCWLGHGVSVLDGVRIGRGSVIGARAVVTKDIPPYSIAVGIPARVVGQRGGPRTPN